MKVDGAPNAGAPRSLADRFPDPPDRLSSAARLRSSRPRRAQTSAEIDRVALTRPYR